MKKFVFPKSRLALVPKLEEVGRQEYADDVAENPNLDIIEHIGEWHMESVSEAGYSEASLEQRLSVRAFARLFRYKTDDLERVKAAVGWNTRFDEYREFGFATLLCKVLSHSPELALALSEAGNGGLGAKGPFGRSSTLYVMPSLIALGHEYQMEVGDLPDSEAEFRKIWLQHMVNEYSAPGQVGDREKSLLALAAVLRVGDLDKLFTALNKAGLSNVDGMQLACAETIVAALRINRAFAAGVSWSQPEN